MIPYGRQSIAQADIDAVVSVLQSDFLTQGPKVPEFEEAMTQYCGAKYAVAVNSATSALHVACLALGLGTGDILWTSPITFVASANCGLYCGAKVDFVDVDPHTYNLCPKALQRKLEVAQSIGQLPKIVVPVHLSGQPCDMEAIDALSKQYGFRVIEDASHAIGGRYKDELIGNCRYSDITVFSFHPVKIITTGEGGMALTDNPELAQCMVLLRSHGITRDPDLYYDIEDLQPIDGYNPPGKRLQSFYYEQISLGFNYRMSDIHAALGLSQMKRLDAYVAKRKELANRYDELLADLPVTCPWQHPDGSSAWHLYIIRLKLDKLNNTQIQVLNSMKTQGIGVNIHYIPVHTQPWYRRMGFGLGMFAEAEKYYQSAVTLPLFATMTDKQQDKVVEVTKNALI